MALMLAPAFVSNVWQAFSGGGTLGVLRRIWPFLLMAAVTVWLGALALTRIDLHLLSALLGVLLIPYSVVSLAGFRVALTARQEAWAGPLFGTVNGVLTGRSEEHPSELQSLIRISYAVLCLKKNKPNN